VDAAAVAATSNGSGGSCSCCLVESSWRVLGRGEHAAVIVSVGSMSKWSMLRRRMIPRALRVMKNRLSTATTPVYARMARVTNRIHVDDDTPIHLISRNWGRESSSDCILILLIEELMQILEYLMSL
jgi:hypothetical protein